MNKRFNSIFTNKLLALIAFTLGIFLVSCAGVKDSQKADMTFRLSALRALPFKPGESYNNARYIVSAKSANYSKTLTFSFMEKDNEGLKPVENIIAKFDDVPVEESLTVSMVLAIPDSYKVPQFSGIYKIDNPALNSEEIREQPSEGDTTEDIEKNFYFKPVYSASKTFTTKAGENFVNLKFEEQNNSLLIDQAMSKNFMANEFSELQKACSNPDFDYVYFQNDIGLAVIKVAGVSNQNPDLYYSGQVSKWKSTSRTTDRSANARVYIDPATSDVYMLFCDKEKIESDNSSIYTLVIKKLSSDQSIAKAYAGKIWANSSYLEGDYSYYYFENESTVHTGNYSPDAPEGEERISPSGKYKASFFNAADLTLLPIGPTVYEVSEPIEPETGTFTFTMKETGSSDETGGTPLYDITDQVKNPDSYKFQTINIASGLYLDTTYNRYLLVNENGTAIAGRGMFFKEALEKFNASSTSYMANLRTPVGTTAEDKRNYAKSSPVKFKEIMQTYAPVYGPLAGLEGSLNASRTKININGTAFSYSYDPDKETITVKSSSNYNPFSNVTTDATTGETPNITLTKVGAAFSKFWHDLKAGKCYIYNASTDAAEERVKLVFNTPSALTTKIQEDISGETNSDFEKPVLVFIDKYDGYQVDTDPNSMKPFHFEGIIGSTSINKDIYIDGNNLSIMNSYNSTEESSTFFSNAANLHLLNMKLYGNTNASNQHGVKTENSDVYLHNTLINGFTATKGSAVLAGEYNATNGNHNHGIFVCDTNVLIGSSGASGGNTTTGSMTNNCGGALHAPYVFMLDGTVSNNTATGTGGGIWADDFIMVGGTVSNNSAESGGGVYVKSRAHLFNGTVITNTASTYGAGIFINCTQTDDNETTSEIGMLSKPDDWKLNVSENKILTSGTDAVGVGAGLAFTNVRTTIFYGTFNNNQILENSGTLAGTGGAIGIKNGATAQITIAEKTSFCGNKAKQGGVFGDSSNNTNRLFVTGGTFKENQATNGGVIYTACSTTSTSKTHYTEISGGTFDSNTATNNGGIIYKIAKGGDCLGITGGIFQNNTAYENGGAIYIIPSNGNYPASTIYVGGKLDGNERIEEGSNDTIKFVSNKSKNGGAIYIDSKSDSFDIQTTIFCGTFKDNGGIFDNIETKCSTVNGGAIYNKKQLYIYSPLFDGNSVLGTADKNPSGAAIYIDGTENNNACVRFDKFNSCLFGNETPNLKKIYNTIDNTNYDKNCSDVHWKYNNTDPEKNIRSLFDSSYSSMAETYVTTIFKDYGEHQETISFEGIQ